MTALWALSAVEQLALLDSRAVSSRELLGAHLDRIQDLPDVNAVVWVDEDAAVREADRVDRARAQGADVGPLGGLPMTIKDGWEVAGMVSTDGDPRWRDHVPSEDAPVVATVREAGAVLFGKSNVPIHCADAQSYNSIYGTTSNPWDLSLSPGGSSGGAAAALAAGMTPLEVGSDVAGSIRLPASWCGVYGLKTTYGLLPAVGHVPGSSRAPRDMWVAGPMARTADDLMLLHDVLTRGGSTRGAAAPLSSFRAVSWIGTGGFETDLGVERTLMSAVTGLAVLGLGVDSAWPGVDLGALLQSYYLLLSATGAVGADGPSPADIRAEHELRCRVGDQIEGMLSEGADILLCPTVNVTAQPHDHSQPEQGRTLSLNGRTTHFYSVCDWNSIASYTYLPAISIPVGMSPQGVPVGLQAIGRRGADQLLVEFARSCEQVLGTPPSPRLGNVSGP